MYGIREEAIGALEGGNYTATALAELLGYDRSAVSHAIVRSHKAGDVRIIDYKRTGQALAPVYALGVGNDVDRPAPPDPSAYSDAYRARHPERIRARSRAWRAANIDHVLAKQAEYRQRRRSEATADKMPVAPPSLGFQTASFAKEPAVSESALQYFEIPEIPGVQRFHCVRLRADLSVDNCRTRYEKANSKDVDADRFLRCRSCAIGAGHTGTDANQSRFRGMTICGRCHRGTTRLIGKHLCISCQNRQYESLKGKNAKGTKPVKLADLDQRSITYRAAGTVKTRTIALSVGADELVMAVLRDEPHAMQFAFRNLALHALFDGEEYDRSIGEYEPQGAPEVAEAAVGAVEVAELVASESAAMPADPYEALRDLVDGTHEVPACAPVMSRRAAKKVLQRGRRQVRVSSLTVGLLRTVGALPRPAPVAAPMAVPLYSASLYSGGSAIG